MAGWWERGQEEDWRGHEWDPQEWHAGAGGDAEWEEVREEAPQQQQAEHQHEEQQEEVFQDMPGLRAKAQPRPHWWRAGNTGAVQARADRSALRQQWLAWRQSTGEELSFAQWSAMAARQWHEVQAGQAIHREHEARVQLERRREDLDRVAASARAWSSCRRHTLRSADPRRCVRSSTRSKPWRGR